VAEPLGDRAPEVAAAEGTGEEEKAGRSGHFFINGVRIHRPARLFA
jgi:hypothetical protein